MIKLLPKTTQTPLHMRETRLVTVRENTAWPRTYKSQVNYRISVRGHILTMKSGLQGCFSHRQCLLAEAAPGEGCSEWGTSASRLVLAVSGSRRPEKDLNPAKSTSSLLEGTDTVVVWRCQWPLFTLSLANRSGLSTVTCLADGCHYIALLLAFLDPRSRLFSLVFIKQDCFCRMRTAQKECQAKMWGGPVHAYW